MSRVALVTGAAGFIGRHLCRHLQEDGNTVLQIDLKLGLDVLTCRLPDADVVFHLAAQTDAYCQDAYADAMANVMGSIRIFEHYRERTIFASSAMVNYPTTPYAISKRAGESYAKMFGVSVVRLCNITGPGGHSVFEAFDAAEDLNIYGNGEQLRNYASVTEAVHALIDHERSVGVRILDGVEMTVNDVAALYPSKPRKYLPTRTGDMLDARQLPW